MATSQRLPLLGDTRTSANAGTRRALSPIGQVLRGGHEQQFSTAQEQPLTGLPRQGREEQVGAAWDGDPGMAFPRTGVSTCLAGSVQGARLATSRAGFGQRTSRTQPSCSNQRMIRALESS